MVLQDVYGKYGRGDRVLSWDEMQHFFIFSFIVTLGSWLNVQVLTIMGLPWYSNLQYYITLSNSTFALKDIVK